MEFISVVVLIVLFITVQGFLIHLWHKQQYDRRLENEYLMLQLEQQQNMYQKMNDVYEKSRVMRHDVKHYLSVVLGLLVNEEYEQAEQMIIDLLGRKMPSKAILYQGSHVINAVLNDKTNLCENNGIEFSVVISGCISERFELDLAIVLANLLDNAIEAEEKQKDKHIWLTIEEQKGMLYVLIKNKIAESVLKENPLLHTTKEDKKKHGIGIQSVKELVRKMDGTFQQYEEDGLFMSYITIPF